jgi:hypothetical protein
MRFSLILIGILAVMPSACTDKPTTKFAILTNGDLYFCERSNRYRLETQIQQFIAKFGPPEDTKHDSADDGSYLAQTTSYYYVNDGIIVTANKDGSIIGYIFYLKPTDRFKQADVQTDKGIKAGAAVRDVTAAYGEPYRRKVFQMEKVGGGEFDDLQLFYRRHDYILTFRFDHGFLDAIQLNAHYLDRLPQ